MSAELSFSDYQHRDYLFLSLLLWSTWYCDVVWYK